MPRIETHLTAEGAEFLVLGQLLIRDILAFKAYTKMASYDVFATNPKLETFARISVKSCWRNKEKSFLIKSTDCEFVVVVKLNRGSKKGNADPKEPEIFVIPAKDISGLIKNTGIKKVYFSDILGLEEKYQNKWERICDYLAESRSPSNPKNAS